MKIDVEKFFQNMFDGLYMVDPERKIVYWNRAAEKITGYTAGEVVNSHCFDNILIHVDDAGNILCHGLCPLAATMRDGVAREAEVYLHHKDGHRLPVLIRVMPQHDENGNIVGAIELFADISARRSMLTRIEELDRLAFLDALTRLANRRYIEHEIESRFSEMRRQGPAFGLLFMDIDDFKRFNDTYGHQTGDAALKAVAGTLAANSRPFDVYGRWGGEEFMGIIRNTSLPELAVIGERMRALIGQSPLKTPAGLLRVTVSIGAAAASPEDTPKTLVERADRLMYESKRAGKNRLTVEGGS